MQGLLEDTFEEPLLSSMLLHSTDIGDGVYSNSDSISSSSSSIGYTLNASIATILNNNSSYANFTDDQLNSNKFILPLWRQIIWSILFGCMIAVATVGNILVIYIVLTTKTMRTVTNYFLVNLSIADAMVSSLNVTFNYVYMLNSTWPFGSLYCKISQAISVIAICASVFTLMAISMDRYMAIVHPLKPRMGKRVTLGIALTIWIVSAILSLPMLLFYTTYTHSFPNGEVRIVCYPGWPDMDDVTGKSKDENLYNVIFLIMTYGLPIGAMTFTYFRISRVLWGSESIGETLPRQAETQRNKRRVVKMLIVVVAIFAVCWLPFHIYFLLTSYFPEITNKPYIQEVYLAIYWLAMSNSMYNPIIYCWMNSRFRHGFARFFRCCPCVFYGPEPGLTRSEALSRYSFGGSPDVRNRLARNGTVRVPLHLHATTAETTTTAVNSRRNSYADNVAVSFENGNSRRRSRDSFNFKPRLPYTTRFQRLNSNPES